MSTRFYRWAKTFQAARDRDVLSQRTDGDLVTEYARSRNDDAFAELLRRHGPMVLNTCRRVAHPDAHLAEDAFQATFMVLAMRAGAVSPPERVGAWLHGVAMNVSRKALSCSRKVPLSGEADLDCFPAQRRETDPDAFAVRSAIDEVLAGLPAKYRSPVVLCELEGRSRADAAETLGLNEGTLSGRLARAKKLMADRLTRRGVTLPAAGISALLSPGEAGAVVPPLLAAATLRSASLVATGLAVDQVASQSVIRLVREVASPMTSTVKLTAYVVVGVLVVAGAVGLAALSERRPPTDPRVDTPDVEVVAGFNAPLTLPTNRWAAVHTLTHKHSITAVAVGADFVATGDRDGALILWDPITGERKEELLDGTGRWGKSIDGIQAAPDGTWLYLSTENAQSAHQVSLAKENLRLAREDRHFPSMGGRGYWVTYGVTADGDYWIERINADNTLLLVKNGLAELKGGGFAAAQFPHEEKVDLVAAGDATAIISISGGVLRRWCIDAKEPLWEVKLDRFEPTALAVTSDGNSIAVGGKDGRVRLYDGMFGKSRSTLIGHIGAVRAISFSGDGKQLVTGGADKTARVYETASGKELAVLNDHTDAVTAVSFGPNGAVIATGSEDRTVKLWRIRMIRRAVPGLIGL
jgi:RNA polymerase sigma factor (sigma-70 family)